jgi:hypothetical protein
MCRRTQSWVESTRARGLREGWEVRRREEMEKERKLRATWRSLREM